MLEKYNRYKVLKVFLDNPLEGFGLREVRRKKKIAPVSVLNYLKEFVRQELVSKEKGKLGPVYIAERDNKSFIFYKKMSALYELHDSGLVDYLWDKLGARAVILYGSYAKGEALASSDIDIFIIGKEKNIDLALFEKKLGKEIHLLFNDNFRKIPNELKNNLVNGIVLRGYVKAF